MYGRQANIRFGGPLTPIVKKLLIINGVVFFGQIICNYILQNYYIDIHFGLSHAGLAGSLKLWQPFTYMFLHSTFSFFHIIFNMLALFMFGGELEELWGSKFFLRFYLVCGVGAGVFIAVMNAFANPVGITIGASGAIFGILMAYGMIWPNREVYIWGIFPVRVKYLVLIMGAIAFFGTLSSASGRGGGVSHIGHLGGLITGFLYLRHKITSAKKGKHTAIKNPISEAFKKRRLKNKQKHIEERIKAKKIIDELLEKIARSGMSSLSAAEKKKLEWARRHYYPENNDTVH